MTQGALCGWLLLGGGCRAGLRTQRVSHGMLGSWFEADVLLRAAARLVRAAELEHHGAPDSIGLHHSNGVEVLQLEDSQVAVPAPRWSRPTEASTAKQLGSSLRCPVSPAHPLCRTLCGRRMCTRLGSDRMLWTAQVAAAEARCSAACAAAAAQAVPTSGAGADGADGRRGAARSAPSVVGARCLRPGPRVAHPRRPSGGAGCIDAAEGAVRYVYEDPLFSGAGGCCL